MNINSNRILISLFRRKTLQFLIKIIYISHVSVLQGRLNAHLLFPVSDVCLCSSWNAGSLKEYTSTFQCFCFQSNPIIQGAVTTAFLMSVALTVINRTLSPCTCLMLLVFGMNNFVYCRLSVFFMRYYFNVCVIVEFDVS